MSTASLAPCLRSPTLHGEDAVAARLPEPLLPLAALAANLWWSWQPEAHDLFRSVDPERWDACSNPVKVLRDMAPARLAALAGDAAFVRRLRALASALDRELERPFAATGVATAARPIAFLCAEYGLHASVPVYSGGLGILAGDLLKQASDDALPMVAVGLFYRRGYFHQRLDRSGWQHEYWSPVTPEELPLRLELDESGAPRKVQVRLRGSDVSAQIWHAQVGRVPLFLLDTDLPENDPVSRFLTSTLYVGDRRFRLMQYAVLAIGGVRALRALRLDPCTFHLNEGHASLAALEIAREETASGVPFEIALGRARERLVFTTHTPVPAGNERYGADELRAMLGELPADLGVGEDVVLALGRGQPTDPQQPFGVTELALRTCRSANAVSRRHGEVARAMWQHLYPGRGADDVPISHVTNGVHLPTWMAPEMRQLLGRYLGPGWEADADPARLSAIDAIPDAELWAVRTELRGRLVHWLRKRTIADRLARGEPIEYVEGAARTFDPHVLTVGFARRVAAYKRLHLLIQNPPRALALLRGTRRIQVVIAGKAHPADEDAKRLVQLVFGLKHSEAASTHVAFVEDYDMAVALQLVAGCDVWVNLPRPPLEASGTSGMKAALNGGLNLSVLDGWWCEGYEEGRTGWGIASEGVQGEEVQDARDAETFYGLLENEVVPCFYERDGDAPPRAWVARMRASLSRVCRDFTAARMLRDYVGRIYPRPA